jgi:glycosyltransferase involved in cell wall biosynthesis
MITDLVFVHLLNDFSGSPKVLRSTIDAFATSGAKVGLYVGSAGDGFLSCCSIQITSYWYRRMGCRILTLITYFLSQVFLFCKLLTDRTINKNAIIYINTLLPFGAALYGKLTGRKIVYHVHEISITPAPLKYMLTTIARMTSSLNIYVSETHMKTLPISNVPTQRVYNSLDADFIAYAAKSIYAQMRNGRFNILMVASLRDYKGVPELLTLADSLISNKEICFDLVVNDEQAAISRYFRNKPVPKNLTIHPRTTDVAPFYANANLVLNLSRVDQWVETFGMTILEAMAFGIPVIVPPVGGPVELVKDGVHGFRVDSRNFQELLDRVLQLSVDQQLCLQMSKACRERAKHFSPEIFAENILAAINVVRNYLA